MDANESILAIPNDDTGSIGIIVPPKIIQFGIRTTAAPQSTVYLRLYWMNYLYFCSLDIEQSSELYLCNVSNTTQVLSSCVDPRIKLYEQLSHVRF